MRFAILTQNPENYSNRRLIEAARNRGHDIQTLETNQCDILFRKNRPYITYQDESLANYDAIIPRIGPQMTFYGLAVVRQFEAMGIYSLNSAHAINVSRDKLHAQQILSDCNISMPDTVFASFHNSRVDLVEALGDIPVVIKRLNSAQGKGTILAQTRDNAHMIIDNFRELQVNFLVQACVSKTRHADIRCFVINGQFMGAMERTAKPGGFRANVHQGSTIKAIHISRKETDMVERAAQTLHLDVAGVDILRSSQGTQLLELNSSPGLEGIEQVTEQDMAGKIITALETNVQSHLANQSNDQISNG